MFGSNIFNFSIKVVASIRCKSGQGWSDLVFGINWRISKGYNQPKCLNLNLQNVHFFNFQGLDVEFNQIYVSLLKTLFDSF